VGNLFRYFDSRYRTANLLVVFCLLTAGILDGIGLSALFPIFTLWFEPAVEAGGAPAPLSPLAGTMKQTLSTLGLEATLNQLVPILIAAFWLKAGVLLLAKRQVGYTVARIATDLRLELLRALMAARWHHFTRLRPGAAANALATESERASLSYQHLALVVGHLIESAIYMGLAIATSWQITAGAAATALMTLFGLNVLVRIASKAGRKQTKYLKSLLSRLTDSLQAVKLLKATGRGSLIGPLLESDTQRLNTALRRRVFSKEALRALQEPILVSSLCGVFLICLWLGTPKAEVLLLGALFAKTIASANKMQRRYQVTVMEASALWSLREMVDSAVSEVEPLPGGATPTLDQGIELRDITVQLDNSVVLENLNLSIPAGSVTAFVGESGSGKTTTADLVTGLIRPSAGEVYIDGVPLAGVDLERWRRLIGYVPQEMLMLHDSVAKNVSLGDPDIAPEQIEQALRDAGAWEFVAALPDGIEYSVGERGSRLSGGQRQRIAIARALVHGAKLLILDEATAALDPENEAAVWSAVERLRGRTTVIAISHQPALARSADQIYRIADRKCTAIEFPRRSERAAP